MTHRAESIVSAVVTTVTGLTTTGSNVYRGRMTPIAADVSNALRVYLGEDSLLGEYSQAKMDWELTILIESFAKSPTAQIDTRLNTIREEVTIALQADYTQGLAYVINTLEGNAARPEFSAEGEQAMGSQVMEWKIHYRRSRTDPGA